MKKVRFSVTEKREKLVRKEEDEDRSIDEVVYDQNSFEGYVTLAPMLSDGPGYCEEMEFSVEDRDVYESFKLGAVYLFSWEEEVVASS